jgi:SpoVK/Ycf46/Vps4 family AAA+-type ATPase
MPRSDLLIKLVRASSTGDQLLFKRTLEAVIAEERQKQHHVLADRLAEYLKTNGNGDLKGPTVLDDRIQQLLIEATPQRCIEDLILTEVVVTACRELVEEHQRRDLLRSYNLEPRSKVLLVGPPGNGKTSLAEAIAEALAIPLLIVRYEGVIGSYLGETAIRLRRLFDYARTRQCVLFFDEFDTVGKERGDIHETGEIKRVVSSLLLQVDSLPSHVLVVTATNHPELLDRAVWRRFQLRLFLPPPDQRQLLEWVSRFEKKVAEPLGYTPSSLAEKLSGLSFAEVEEFGADVLRRRILNVTEKNMKHVIDERLKQWTARYKQAGEQKVSL